jgi:hypothetical protein
MCGAGYQPAVLLQSGCLGVQARVGNGVIAYRIYRRQKPISVTLVHCGCVHMLQIMLGLHTHNVTSGSFFAVVSRLLFGLDSHTRLGMHRKGQPFQTSQHVMCARWALNTVKVMLLAASAILRQQRQCPTIATPQRCMLSPHGVWAATGQAPSCTFMSQ